MKIVVSQFEGMSTIVDYLDFNEIAYELDDMWDTNDNGYWLRPDIVQDSNSTLVIVNAIVFRNLCTWDASRQQLIDFCNNGNKIWVWSNIDNLMHTVIAGQKALTELDMLVPFGAITIFPDGTPTDNHPSSNLRNIHIIPTPFNFFVRTLRVHKASIDKLDCSKDYMLTTCKKRSRAHRAVLWKQLTAIDGLLDCGHVNYAKKTDIFQTPAWIGHQQAQHIWHDGHPSMDLYLDSWLEIVPETLYRDGYFLTEKTVKPLITKTPFLMVSTRYQLEYMKQFGFQTFDSIIDESYDNEPRIEDRVRLMLVQLQDIIKNGTQAFYNECASILEHNQNTMFTLAGRKEHDMDIFFNQHIEAAEHDLG